MWVGMLSSDGTSRSHPYFDTSLLTNDEFTSQMEEMQHHSLTEQGLAPSSPPRFRNVPNWMPRTKEEPPPPSCNPSIHVKCGVKEEPASLPLTLRAVSGARYSPSSRRTALPTTVQATAMRPLLGSA